MSKAPKQKVTHPDDGLTQRISDALHRSWRGRVIATSAEQLAQDIAWEIAHLHAVGRETYIKEEEAIARLRAVGGFEACIKEQGDAWLSSALVEAAEKGLLREIADLREPILTFNGMVLDGKHRYRACERAGVEPRFIEYEGNGPLGEVVSRNVQRRHLTDKQRAEIAATLANMPHGGDRVSETSKVSNETLVTIAEAAKVMKVSEISVKRAKARQAGKSQDIPPKQRKKRQLREPPPYQPDEEEQQRLDMLEKELGLVGRLMESIGMRELILKLDTIEKGRWLGMLTPMAELHKVVLKCTGY